LKAITAKITPNPLARQDIETTAPIKMKNQSHAGFIWNGGIGQAQWNTCQWNTLTNNPPHVTGSLAV
jgi:hypothetical protein